MRSSRMSKSGTFSASKKSPQPPHFQLAPGSVGSSGTRKPDRQEAQESAEEKDPSSVGSTHLLGDDGTRVIMAAPTGLV